MKKVLEKVLSKAESQLRDLWPYVGQVGDHVDTAVHYATDRGELGLPMLDPEERLEGVIEAIDSALDALSMLEDDLASTRATLLCKKGYESTKVVSLEAGRRRSKAAKKRMGQLLSGKPIKVQTTRKRKRKFVAAAKRRTLTRKPRKR